MKRFWQRGRGAGEQDPNQLPLVWNPPRVNGPALPPESNRLRRVARQKDQGSSPRRS